MNQSSSKLTGLPFNALLSSILGIISGSAEIVTAIIALSSTLGQRYGWDRLALSSSVVLVCGLLIFIGSLLILLRRYNLGAVLVLVPAILSSFFELPLLMDALQDYGYWLKVEEIAFLWLLMLALPIVSGVLALSVKKKSVLVKEGVVSKKRSYWKASFALGLACGIPNLIIGPFLIGSWPLGVLAPFLIIDGLLIIYGSFCVLQKKFARGALLILIPGLLFGFYGLPLLIATLMSLLHLGYSWIFADSLLSFLVGLAFPIASSVLAIYSRE